MEPMIYVIAFAGCARSGKSSSAQFVEEYIKEKHPLGMVMHMSFAKPLKEGLERMGVYKDKEYELYRELAQKVGTNYLRKHNDNWWVDLMRQEIDNIPKTGQWKVVIIDDVRFPNESALVKEYQNGYNIFVWGGDERIDLELSVYDHDSEKLGVYYEKMIRGVPVGESMGDVGMDKVVDSRGSLDELKTSVYGIMDEIMKGH